MSAMLSKEYVESFYNMQKVGSYKAAEAILPIVFDATRPRSLVDFGCGVGTWLAVAQKLGVERRLGLEGPWVKSQPLAISGLQIQEVDLEQPISLSERFDLAISLEVAEHLSPRRADSFIADLCVVSDIVLFSAAIPGQGGTHHVNENWPSYWAERFVRMGYVPLDIIRPVIRANIEIPFWYRVNTILYAKPAKIRSILPRISQAHLFSLDLLCHVETVGVKTALSKFFESGRELSYWAALKSKQYFTR